MNKDLLHTQLHIATSNEFSQWEEWPFLLEQYINEKTYIHYTIVDTKHHIISTITWSQIDNPDLKNTLQCSQNDFVPVITIDNTLDSLDKILTIDAIFHPLIQDYIKQLSYEIINIVQDHALIPSITPREDLTNYSSYPPDEFKEINTFYSPEITTAMINRLQRVMQAGSKIINLVSS